MRSNAPPLTDAAGNPVADVLLDGTGGVSWAVVTSHAPADVVAPAVLRRLRGHRVVTSDTALADLLVAAGGTVQRRGHDYAYDLSAAPPEWAAYPAPDGFTVTPGGDAVALAEAHAAANPPGHPDHEEGLDHVADLRAMLAGEVVGPNVPDATWQVSDTTGPCGAVIVSERQSAEHGTTICWVLDVFVHPRHQGRGLGGVLLRRAVAGAARAGYPVLGLVVSDGNPARVAYEKVGFRLTYSATNVDLPPA